MSSLPLRRLQRWFALCVEHPATAAAALATDAAEALVPRARVAAGRVLLPNPRMDAAAMLQIYNAGYLARLIEVLQSDFGCVQHVLGEPAFRELAARFVAAHPSRHPNLNRLGAPFPAFVRTQRSLPHRAFLAELALLERTLAEAFDAPEFVPLAAGTLARVPANRQADARLTPNPSVRLLALRHPVDAFYQAWKEQRQERVPRLQRSWLAVFRREDRVWRHRLLRAQFLVLAALAAGEPLGEALALARRGEPVQRWFEGFARDGLFTSVRAGR